MRLRSRNRNPITRHDLLLISEYFAAAGIHQHLDPVHIVRAIFLVIAKSLYTGEILESPALRIQKRLVNAEVMGIAVYISDWLLKGNYLVAQRKQELLISVWSAIRLGTPTVACTVE